MTPDRCDNCRGDSKVLETTSVGSTVKRRRVCTTCGSRWTTYERRGRIVAKEPPEEKPPYLGGASRNHVPKS